MPISRKTAAAMKGADPHPDPVALNLVLTTENVSFSTYAMMLALQREGAPLGVMRLAQRVGYSYWAVRNQLRRTPYFQIRHKPAGRHVDIDLTDEARAKLDRIQKRIGAP